MSRLILVKHSRPDIQPQVPASRWRLSDEGRGRCKLLTDALASFHLREIVCSAEPKARETTEIVAAGLGITFRTVDGLHEHDRDNVGQLSPEEFQRAVQECIRRPDELVFGRETIRHASQRFASAVDGVLADQPGRDVAIIAHGTVISCYVAARCGSDAWELWQRLGLPSFVVVSVPQGRVLQLRESFSSRAAAVGDIRLRPATAGDIDMLYAIHRAAIGPYVKQVWGWDEQWQAQHFREHFPPSSVQVIQDGGQDVGLWQVERQEDCIFLANVEIAPDHQRRGIGTHLIRQLQAQAAAQGLPVQLQVLKVNPARGLYERLGFRVTGQTDTHWRMSTT